MRTNLRHGDRFSARPSAAQVPAVLLLLVMLANPSCVETDEDFSSFISALNSNFVDADIDSPVDQADAVADGLSDAFDPAPPAAVPLSGGAAGALAALLGICGSLAARRRERRRELPDLHPKVLARHSVRARTDQRTRDWPS